MSSNYQFWKDVKDRFEFFLMLAALCGCGYLLLHQVIYLVLLLIFGGIAAATTPFYNIALEKMEALSNAGEIEANQTRAVLERAQEIISNYLNQHPDIEYQFPGLEEVVEVVDQSQRKAEQIYQVQKRNREIKEAEEREERQQREAWLRQERRDRGYTGGHPPLDEHSCPFDYPIKATTYLRDSNYKGIYYMPGRYNGKVQWCFKNWQEAEANDFRPPMK